MTEGKAQRGGATPGGAGDTVIDAVERIAALAGTLLWREGTREGLTPLQIRILLSLARHDAEELRRVSRLAAELGIGKPTVSDAVRVLARKGLVEKRGSGRDARATILRLTPAGERAARRVEGWRDALRGPLAAFPPERTAQALGFLLELIRALQEEGAIEPARMCLTCANFRRGGGGRGAHLCALTGRRMGEGDLSLDCGSQVPAAPRSKRGRAHGMSSPAGGLRHCPPQRGGGAKRRGG